MHQKRRVTSACRVRSLPCSIAEGILAVKIVDIRATTVTVPLEAPLRHSNGAHWGRFVRTIVEVETDDGLIGLGEMGEAARVLRRHFADCCRI